MPKKKGIKDRDHGFWDGWNRISKCHFSFNPKVAKKGAFNDDS